MLRETDNLIFDLGGVIINLDTRRTVEAFARMAGRPVAAMQPLMASPFFVEYEKGMVSDGAFRDHVRAALRVAAPDAEIDAAWNAMLLDIPDARFELLRSLAPHYRLYLLSNTNAIHQRCFHQHVLERTGTASLAPFFTKTYYSHQLHMRKPDAEIYEFVLTDAGLRPAATVFLDDNENNLAGAQQLGIRTFHVHHPDAVFDLFKK